MTIKRKTYRNFLYIMRIIQGKGYDKDEAEKITHRIFDEWNPAGMSIIARANMIISKEEEKNELHHYSKYGF